MKKSAAFLSVIVVLSLAACSGSKKGGGCDCPTFGSAEVELIESIKNQDT